MTALLDTSGWLEMLDRAPRHQAFRERLEQADRVMVPAIVIYEVYKIVKREHGQDMADLTAGRLRTHEVVPLTEALALEAADYSLEHGLPMADAIIYATAQAHGATVITGDAHFARLPLVEYIGAADGEGA